jgi:hypothetical protein
VNKQILPEIAPYGCDINGVSGCGNMSLLDDHNFFGVVVPSGLEVPVHSSLGYEVPNYISTSQSIVIFICPVVRT